MDFYEMGRMWHEIRERVAIEEEGLSVQERFARSAKLVDEYSEKYRLKIAKRTRDKSD